jgi:hypothetical protein
MLFKESRNLQDVKVVAVKDQGLLTSRSFLSAKEPGSLVRACLTDDLDASVADLVITIMPFLGSAA